MDADLSHDPRFLPALIASAANGAGLTIGSRYVDGGRVENWPLRRMMLSAFANTYIRTATGLRVRDCTSGYRCWRREALARMPLDTHRVGRLLVSRRGDVPRRAAGMPIAEVPIVFVERRQGASKLSSGGAARIAGRRRGGWRCTHGRS